jgi:hypothetical protein
MEKGVEMNAFVLSLAAAVCTAGAAAPAFGAPAAAAAVYEAGRCMVRRDPRAAAALILALPSDNSPADLSSLRGACAGAEGATAMQVRGAIAQALFLRDFRVFGREPQPRAVLVNLALPVESSVGGTRSAALYRWGDCVVRNDGAGAQRFLVSALRSAEESAAIAGLQTYMQACLPADTEFQVRASELRGVLAQSAYHAMYRFWTGQLEVGRRPRN